jgi:hypothetical protein
MFQKKLKAKTELLLSQQRFRTTTRTNNMIKTARTMTCSICHDTGHNKRSCIRRNCRDIIEDIVSSAVQIADELGQCEDCNRVLYESVHIFCYAHKDNEDMTLCHQCGEDWDHKAEGWTRDDDEDKDESEEEEKIKEKRIDKVWEFMEWQKNLIIDYKSGKITHAQGMRMMKELYPEFTPDDKEGEDSFTEKDAELKVVREIVQCKRPNAELEFGEDGSALRFIFADGRMQIYKITPDVLQEIGEERLDAYFEYDAREGSTGTLSNRWAEFHPLSVRDVMNQEHYRGK